MGVDIRLCGDAVQQHGANGVGDLPDDLGQVGGGDVEPYLERGQKEADEQHVQPVVEKLRDIAGVQLHPIAQRSVEDRPVQTQFAARGPQGERNRGRDHGQAGQEPRRQCAD